VEHPQVREEHRVIADLVGKGHHVRTVPVPEWVKRAIDEWTAVAEITEGNVFRRVNKRGRIWGAGITPKGIRHIVKAAAQRAGIMNLAPMRRHVCTLMSPCRRRTGTDPVPPRARIRANNGYLGCKQQLRRAVNDQIGLDGV